MCWEIVNPKIIETETLEIDSYKYAHQISDNVQKHLNGGKIIFLTNYSGGSRYPYAKKVSQFTQNLIQNNLRLNKNKKKVKKNVKAMNLLENKCGRKSLNLDKMYSP